MTGLRDKGRLVINRGGLDKADSRKRETTYRILGVVMFCVGVVLGIGLLGASVYADFEASLFDIPLSAEKSIRPFTCPILIDNDEVGLVRATVKNDTDKSVQRLITGHFSQYSVLTLREETFRTNFDPYESKDMYWEITAQDAVYDHLILVKVYLYARYANPARDAGCGVLVLDLPWNFTGGQVVAITLALSIVLMFVGGRLWWMFTRPSVGNKAEGSRGVISLIVTIITGLLASYLGFFGVAVGLFYIAMLMVGVMVPHFIFSRWRV